MGLGQELKEDLAAHDDIPDLDTLKMRPDNCLREKCREKTNARHSFHTNNLCEPV